MAKRKSDFEITIVLAALKVAAKKPWHEITLDDVANAAKISTRKTRNRFTGTNALLPAIVRYIDRTVAQNVGTIDRNASTHDRLFEVMMARFDALQTHRQGILSIIRASKSNPAIALFLFHPLMTSMQHMLRLAGLAKKGHATTIQNLGTLMLFRFLVFRWETDASSDMSRTMASLDKALRFREVLRVHLPL